MRLLVPPLSLRLPIALCKSLANRHAVEKAHFLAEKLRKDLTAWQAVLLYEHPDRGTWERHISHVKKNNRDCGA